MAARSKKPPTSAKTPPPEDPAKIGRPPKEIDLEEVTKLAGLQCTYQDAADWFDVSLSTFKRRMKQKEYREAWEAGLGKGRVSIRRAQFELAKKNATMAIFLGKQYLGQRDVVTQEMSGPNGGPIEISAAKRTLLSRISGIAERGRMEAADRESE